MAYKSKKFGPRPHTTIPTSGKVTRVRDLLKEIEAEERPYSAAQVELPKFSIDEPQLDKYLKSLHRNSHVGSQYASTMSINSSQKSVSARGRARSEVSEQGRLRVGSMYSTQSGYTQGAYQSNQLLLPPGAKPVEKTPPEPHIRPKSAWNTFTDHILSINTDSLNFQPKVFARRNPSMPYRQVYGDLEPDTKVALYDHDETTSLMSSVISQDASAVSDALGFMDDKENFTREDDLLSELQQVKEGDEDNNIEDSTPHKREKSFEKRVGKAKAWQGYQTPVTSFMKDSEQITQELYRRYLNVPVDNSWMADLRKFRERYGFVGNISNYEFHSFYSGRSRPNSARSSISTISTNGRASYKKSSVRAHASSSLHKRNASKLLKSRTSATVH